MESIKSYYSFLNSFYWYTFNIHNVYIHAREFIAIHNIFWVLYSPPFNPFFPFSFTELCLQFFLRTFPFSPLFPSPFSLYFLSQYQSSILVFIYHSSFSLKKNNLIIKHVCPNISVKTMVPGCIHLPKSIVL